MSKYAGYHTLYSAERAGAGVMVIVKSPHAGLLNTLDRVAAIKLVNELRKELDAQLAALTESGRDATR